MKMNKYKMICCETGGELSAGCLHDNCTGPERVENVLIKKGYAVIRVGKYGGAHPVYISEVNNDEVQVCWPNQHLLTYPINIVQLVSQDDDAEERYNKTKEIV
jgi:hypothetical protein